MPHHPPALLLRSRWLRLVPIALLSALLACGTSEPPEAPETTPAEDEMVDPVLPTSRPPRTTPRDEEPTDDGPAAEGDDEGGEDDGRDDEAPQGEEPRDDEAPADEDPRDDEGDDGEGDEDDGARNDAPIDPAPSGEKLPPLPFEEEGRSDDLEILEATMAANVRNRMPVGRGEKFRPGKLWAWIRARNVGEEATVLTTIWRYEGREMHRSELNIGVSKGWRTWSYHTITSGQIGSWSVELLDPRGERIQMLPFTVVAAGSGKEPPGKLP